MAAVATSCFDPVIHTFYQGLLSAGQPKKERKGRLIISEHIYRFYSELPGYLEHMQPMFEPQVFSGSQRAKSGKYSFLAQDRIDIFRVIIE
jgi:hypothetical protein